VKSGSVVGDTLQVVAMGGSGFEVCMHRSIRCERVVW
jgi:hypothetical protein